MGRLTFDGNFCDIAQCRTIPCPCNNACTQKQVWERLKAYEDAGLMPAEVHSMSGEWCAMMSVLNGIGSYDRLRELAEADKEGRLVVLPCKVGDILYKIFKERAKCSAYGECFDEYSCCGCECECDSTIQYVIRPIQPNTLPSLVQYIGDIGKTVFLTREEAEKSLEAMKND